MRSGGAVVASDIPVHREVYADAAHFFSPYSIGAAAQAIAAVIDPAHNARREELIDKGKVVSERYLPERILPMWWDLLQSSKPARNNS